MSPPACGHRAHLLAPPYTLEHSLCSGDISHGSQTRKGKGACPAKGDSRASPQMRASVGKAEVQDFNELNQLKQPRASQRHPRIQESRRTASGGLALSAGTIPGACVLLEESALPEEKPQLSIK